MKKSKKKKIIIIIIIAFLIFFILGALRKMNKKYITIDDFTNVRELVEYYNCKYISLKNSDAEGYDKDLRIYFPLAPVDEVYDVSNQTFYENVIKDVCNKLNYKPYRIIDEKRGLTIEIKYNEEDKIVEYRINNDNNFFKTQMAKSTLNKRGESLDEKLSKNTRLNINSEELKILANNNWKNSSSLGNKYRFSDTREIYWDKGFETRVSGGSVLYIKFTERYHDEIVSGITTGLDNEKIKSILGNPDYVGLDSESIDIVGYVLNHCYYFFSKGEVYVCNIEEVDTKKDNEMITAFEQMNKDGDYATFCDKLTTLYTDYSKYFSNDSMTEISYPTRGIKFCLGYNNLNGMEFYGNYRGKYSLDNNGTQNCSFYYNKDLMFEFIKREIDNDDIARIINYGGENELGLDKFNLIQDSKSIKIYSVDKTYMDSSIRKSVNKVLYYNDGVFVYTVNGEGIYKYDAKDCNNKNILETTENINLENITDDTLYYNNGKTIKLK